MGSATPPPPAARVVMSSGDISRALRRVAHEILERNKGPAGLVLLGIPSRGVPLARRLAAVLHDVEGVDIPVGTLGLPYEVDSDQVTSFVCSNEKHFTLGYLDWGIVFSTGIGGVIPMRISGSTAGVRYDGGNFTVITVANRALPPRYPPARSRQWRASSSSRQRSGQVARDRSGPAYLQECGDSRNSAGPIG